MAGEADFYFRPIITEKDTALKEFNKYTFEVAREANIKTE